jgi:hypothetical protein
LLDIKLTFAASGDLREIGLAKEIQNLVEGLVKDPRNMIM